VSGIRAAYEGSRSMKQGITLVGLDTHKESIPVAMLLPGQVKPVEWASRMNGCR